MNYYDTTDDDIDLADQLQNRCDYYRQRVDYVPEELQQYSTDYSNDYDDI